MLKKLFRDQRGAYGGAELMLIVAIAVVVTSAVMAAFKGDGTVGSGLAGGAGTVVDKVNTAVTAP
ncbi:MAG: hypothetical protein QMC81_02970 [Thermoanaerobacterales bacterium]|nr:hypothetical protein [Thermoanaerobacterales bacterium]